MQSAANFYGLTLRVVTTSSSADNPSIRKAVERKETIGVVIDADALSAVNENALLRALGSKTGGDTPLLILGIGPDSIQDSLKAWSGGGVTRCATVESSPDSQFTFGRFNGITEQLANLDVLFSAKNASYLALKDNGTTKPIESIRDGRRTFPVFVESTIGRQRVFLASAAAQREDAIGSQDLVSAFLWIAPAMIFTKFCAGDSGWHTLRYYANFTIDDPWLREPYGYVNFHSLLQEMEKHDFHTTIAFIPWNYDRSQPNVVSLFRNHPDRFSIAIHGDNHDHKEFTDYRSKPLVAQVIDLKQALARMERFQALTGIPYDKVMIFPHSIAPEQTLGALKMYNYVATVNSSNVPQNATAATGLSAVLRPVTLSFEGFPSIRRYPAAVQIPEAYIAIDQFLGNPVFFYAHSDLFSQGIGAFDHVADEVNKLEPATEWRSLGEIVRHLYLVKLRDDSNYDVLALSNNICLENTTGRNSTYFVQKQESGGQMIGSVTVNGRIQPYTLQEGKIGLQVSIPPGGTSCVAIQYANDLQLASINPSHDSFVDYLLRIGSDFRDIYLAKSSVGLAVIRFYDEHLLTPTEVIGGMFLLLIAITSVVLRLRISASRRLRSNRDHLCRIVQ